MIYTAFLPNYYSSLVKAQQQSLIIDNLYFFVADGVTKDAVANDSPKTIKDEQITINQIMYGAKLTQTNLIPMARKIVWQSNKVFSQYDSTNPNLNISDFYCINSNGAVYKCIDNNNGAKSTEEPNNLLPGPFKLSDGYIWIYLYRISENQMLDYSYEDLMPLFVDPAVTTFAKRGTISTIDIENGGTYNEYHTGYIQSVSNTLIRIEDSASKHSGAYNTMGFYIQNGPGQGEIRQIIDYTSNTSGNYVTLSSTLGTAGLGSQYDIAPYVKITGNGSGSAARSILTGDSVTKIEMLNRGSEYTLAQATLVANSVYSTAGSLSVNISPPKGHGGDIYQELYVNDVLINIEMDNYIIDNNFPVNEVTFAKVGFIRGLIDETTMTLYNQPTFNNTFTASIPTVDSVFEVGDIIKPFNGPAPTAQIVFANTSSVIGVYQTPFLRFSPGMVVTNQNNIQGTVIDITQPQVKFIGTDVVCQVNTNTIQRNENSRELLIILSRVR